MPLLNIRRAAKHARSEPTGSFFSTRRYHIYRMGKIGRNAPCTCGSGKKYKKCCGDPLAPSRAAARAIAPEQIASLIRKHAADEEIRERQQGRGRPIISTKFRDYTVVASGNTIHFSKNWKTFPDFLMDYIKKALGADWGNSEIAKPWEERHPILHWYDALCRYQATLQTKKGEIYSAEATGAVYCYMGLAYSLYLIKHNVELQERLVARLKNIQQFQGAYYELLVANCLIRSGFELELEDETDRASKHCEFAARSKRTGKRYWIEAKMRSEAGVLGKTKEDGSTSKDVTSQLTKHLREALKKPAKDERMIFIDLNAEPNNDSGIPDWLDQAIRRLDAREKDLADGEEAYVFVSNMAFHRTLDDTAQSRELLAYGLGIPDFGKPGEIRLSDWYRNKQKHIDAHDVMDAFRTYPQMPDTFDGQPASEAYRGSHNRRLRVGETYFFEDAADGGVTGEVTSVAVIDSEKCAYVGVSTTEGTNVILKSQLSDAEFEDYQKYGDAYFGEPETRNSEIKDDSELYEWLVETHSKYPRENLLKQARSHGDFERLKQLDHEEFVLEFCEAMVGSIRAKRGQT